MNLNLIKFLTTLAVVAFLPSMVEAPWIAVILVLVAPVFYKPYCRYVGQNLNFPQVALACAFVMCLNFYWIEPGVGVVMWVMIAAAFLDEILRTEIDGEPKRTACILGGAYLVAILVLFVCIHFIKLYMSV